MRQEFDVYAVGSFGPPDEWNPHAVAERLGAWPLLQLLRGGPLTVAALAERSDLTLQSVQNSLDRLSALGVAKRLGEQYGLGFAWLSGADQEAIQSISLPVAAALAERIGDRRTAIDHGIDRLTARRWCDPSDLRFALVGCFGLDWAGLEALKGSGHLVHEKKQAGDRRYVMYVQDRVERHNQKDYAGSHSIAAGDYTWTSFGDHSGRRLCLPDLVWEVERPEGLPAHLQPVRGMADGLEPHLGTAAEAFIGLVRGTPPSGIGHTLLQAAGAMRVGRPAVPLFFRQDDGAAMEQVVAIVRESLLTIIRDRYQSLEAGVADLPALRSGVPFGECFNYIWHVIFGHTNRLLAEQGYLADPEPAYPGEGRYRWWLTIS